MPLQFGSFLHIGFICSEGKSHLATAHKPSEEKLMENRCTEVPVMLRWVTSYTCEIFVGQSKMYMRAYLIKDF